MRYPKAGRGSKWTIKELESITSSSAGNVLSDGGSLTGELRVASDGAVSIAWRYGFKWEGRKAHHYCGAWPKVTLADIRERRDRARGQIKLGVNPNDQKRADKIGAQAEVEAVIAESQRQASLNAPFEDMFTAWLQDGVARSDGNAEIRRAFEKDVLPKLGDKPVKALTEHDLRAVLRAMVKRGVHRMTVRVYNDLVQLFAWAEKRQPWRGLMVDGNPAELIEIEKILPAGVSVTEERDRVLLPEELRELRLILSTMGDAYANTPAGKKYEGVRSLQATSQIAVWLCLSTACRIGELLMSEWRHVDLLTGVWFIPKENTKRTRGQRQDHTIYLSAFAVRQFKALYELTGDTDWCFPARHQEGHVCVKSVSKQIGDRQCRFKSRKPLKNRRHDDTLVLSRGTRGEWTPHDMRRTAATMMQALRISPDVIDRCQNHVLAGSKVRRHYMHHDYAEEKREAWRLLGDQIDAVLNADRASVTFSLPADPTPSLSKGNLHANPTPVTS